MSATATGEALFAHRLDSPCALVEIRVLERNLAHLAKTAAAAGTSVRPHIKTHKSPRIACRQVELGAVGVTCATLDEATGMVGAGIEDVLVYYPMVGERPIDRLIALADRARVSTTVEDLTTIDALDAAARGRGIVLDVLVDVDTGLGRTGVGLADVDELARAVGSRPGLRLRGIGTHEGFSYALHDPGERSRVVRERLGEFAAVGSRLGVEVVSCGSTPSLADALAVDGITEVRPGNYAFLDRIQVDLGVADPGDCALSVLATVVSVRDGGHATLDAGSKSFSSDLGTHGVSTLSGHGLIRDHPGMEVVGLSEEHGFLNTAGESLALGERLRIVPNHACTCAAAIGDLTFVDGEEVVEVEHVVGRRGGAVAR